MSHVLVERNGKLVGRRLDSLREILSLPEGVTVIPKGKPLPGEEGLHGCLPDPFMIYF